MDIGKTIERTTSGHHAEAQIHWSDTYRQGILREDTHVADRSQPAFVSGVVDESGQPLTLERRRQIMAQAELREVPSRIPGMTILVPRLPDGEVVDGKGNVVMGKPEKLGESAIRLRPKGLKFLPARDYDGSEHAEAAEVAEAVALERAVNGKSNE